jgi:hypothetical protein
MLLYTRKPSASKSLPLWIGDFTYETEMDDSSNPEGFRTIAAGYVLVPGKDGMIHIMRQMTDLIPDHVLQSSYDCDDIDGPLVWGDDDVPLYQEDFADFSAMSHADRIFRQAIVRCYDQSPEAIEAEDSAEVAGPIDVSDLEADDDVNPLIVNDLLRFDLRHDLGIGAREMGAHQMW